MDDEIVAQYSVAKSERPYAGPDELAELIVSRLSGDDLLRLAADALMRESSPGGRRELAMQHVRQFVLEMESDPEDDASGGGE